ncbi:MAG: hypothetical protein H7070_12090 [Saprospiraceae bacterium]|nr:hypothetical protein [Pyrinomonadaceae bacterium]
MKEFIRKFLRWMPISKKAMIEYYFDNSLGKEFGGPFNGQNARQQIFKDLSSELAFAAIIETGTFRGVTTAFMSEHTSKPVFTVEAEPRFFYYATHALRRFPKTKVKMGDSRNFITELISDEHVPKKNVFFYLDAHWNADLPLSEEVHLIEQHWTDAVIMIDDFEVPGDDGYKFDDYGEGKKLCLDYLGDTASNWSAFFPSATSDEETGFKRGCVILASKSLKEKLKTCTSLRLFEAASSA